MLLSSCAKSRPACLGLLAGQKFPGVPSKHLLYLYVDDVCYVACKDRTSKPLFKFVTLGVRSSDDEQSDWYKWYIETDLYSYVAPKTPSHEPFVAL